MPIQPRLIQTEGYTVLSGVQMVVKAGLEEGIDTLVGAQLDAPPGYADLLSEHAPLFNDKGLRTLTQPDARQAVAAMRSAWLAGRRVVGVLDAAGVVDAASVLLAGDQPEDAQPGAVVLALGGSETSTGQAAIALLRRAGWAVIEPALQDEVMRFAKDGLGMSAASGLPVALALPSELLGGAATVACAPNYYPASAGDTPTQERASENVEPVTALLSEARNARVNTVVNPPGKDEALPIALVTIGRSFGWARQAMAELGLAGRVPMLRIGLLSVLDPAWIGRHAGGCQQLLVLDPSGIGVGQSVCAAVQLINTPQQTGKDDDDDAASQPHTRALLLEPQAGPVGVIELLRPWLTEHAALPHELVTAGFDRLDARPPGSSVADADVIAQDLPRQQRNPPAGSSLVDVSVVVGRLRRDLADSQHMAEQHRIGPIDLSVFGELDDTARLLLGQWVPRTNGLACDGRMAGAAAAGAGTDGANRSLVLMTSRRFFSLGTSAIADAVRGARNAVFVIHTEDPAEALGPRRRWQRRPKVNTLDMQSIVEAIGVNQRDPAPSVTTIDPSDRPRMRRLLERLVISDGVHVVIARRRRGPRYYHKASEVHQKQSARRGYVAKQGCLIHCPEAGALSPRRRVELGVLGVDPPSPDQPDWTTSVSWSWHDETVMHALGEPSVGLAILERGKHERSRVVAEDLDDLPEPATPIHAKADAWRATLTGMTGSAFDLTLRMLIESGAAMGYLIRSTQAPDCPDEPEARRADLLFTRREPAESPLVPTAPGRSSSPMLTATPVPGRADLLLATELTEGARLSLGPHSPVSPGQTHTLIDTLLIPNIQALWSGAPPDRDALMQIVGPTGNASSDDHANVLPIAQLAEWFWGHQRYAAWVYLGFLVQRGLAPLTIKAIDAAAVNVLGVTDPRAAEATKVGRKLAIDPDYARRAMQVESPTLDALLRTLGDDLAEQVGSGRGASLAGSFQALVQPLLDKTQPLDDATRRELIIAAQRCVLWAGAKHGPAYCEKFVNAIQHVIAIDKPDRDYALTRAAIQGLASAMLIPDEVYLAALLTAPARYRRDRKRFNISLEQGDRIGYVHILRPEFDLFKRRIGFTVTLGERALKTLSGMHVLRRIRPGWYRAQRAFRDLYLQVLTELNEPATDAAYRHARDIARCTQVIVGRGDTRRESVKKARRNLEKLLASEEPA